MKHQLLLPAAGMGLRLGLDQPKALVDVAGAPMLLRTLARFEPMGLVEGAVIVVPPDRRDAIEAVVRAAYPRTRFSFVPGGAERQLSVFNGLSALDSDTAIVVIHDAARPFVAGESIQASLEAAAAYGAATVAIPCVDTILAADEEDFLERTPERGRLWACQTPQTFGVSVIRAAHVEAKRHGFIGTDDASLVQRAGGRVKLVRGTALNFKITTPEDLALAAYVVRERLA